MAVANDEWNGELTQFLDKLPARPCMVPPAPSFCSVCGSINATVARPCRFYALRHERERGQTFIELEPKKRPDTFEIELDFEEEDEEELAGAPMFEFTRPASTTAVKGKIKPAAAPKIERPVEVEIYEAEVVEVIEEPPAAPAAKHPSDDEIRKLAEAEAEARKLESELIEKQARAEREREQRETEELERKVREDRERELLEKSKLEDKALEEGRAADKAVKPAPPRPADDQILSRDEEERLEREIEEELAKVGLAPATPGKAQEPESPGKPPERPLPTDQVIAPIYSQPILKIIPSEGESPKAGQPLPPPPPGYGAPMPAPAEKAPEEKAEPLPHPAKEEPPAAPPAPEEPAAAPKPEKSAPEAARPAPSPAEPAPKEAAPAPGQRRTGGLYGIFRKAPKEQPKPDNKELDAELAKRLKKAEK